MDDLKIPIILLLIVIALAFFFIRPGGRGTSTIERPTPTDDTPAPVITDEKPLVNEATKLLDSEKYEEIIKVLKPVINSASHEVQALLGYAYAGTKDYEKSAEAFEKALAAKADPIYGYSLAYVFETMGEITYANQVYTDLLRAKLNTETRNKVFLGVGRTALMLNDNNSAMKAFGEAIEIDPTQEIPYIELFKLMKMTRNFANLASVRKKGDSFHQASFNYNFWLGQIHYSLGKADDALNFFRKAAKLNPKNSSPYYYIYRLLRRTRKIEQAISELESFYELNPFMPYVFFQAALDAKRENRLDIAFKFIRSALTMDRSLLGYDDKGTLYAVEKFVLAEGTAEEKAFVEAFSAFVGGDYHKAHALISRSISTIKDQRLNDDAQRLLRGCNELLNRDYQNAQYWASQRAQQEAAMAALRTQMGQADSSHGESQAESLKRAAMMNPNDLKLQYSTALQLARSGDTEGAKLFLRETIRINPGVHEAYYSLAKIAQHEGNLHEAQEHLKEAIRRNPNSSQALSFSALISYEAGDTDRARQEAEGAIKANPNNNEARLILAKLLAQENMNEKAIEHINLALGVENDLTRRNEFEILKRQLSR